MGPVKKCERKEANLRQKWLKQQIVEANDELFAGKLKKKIAEGEKQVEERSELHVILMQNNNSSNAHPSRGRKVKKGHSFRKRDCEGWKGKMQWKIVFASWAE